MHRDHHFGERHPPLGQPLAHAADVAVKRVMSLSRASPIVPARSAPKISKLAVRQRTRVAQMQRVPPVPMSQYPVALAQDRVERRTTRPVRDPTADGSKRARRTLPLFTGGASLISSPGLASGSRFLAGAGIGVVARKDRGGDGTPDLSAGNVRFGTLPFVSGLNSRALGVYQKRTRPTSTWTKSDLG